MSKYVWSKHSWLNGLTSVAIVNAVNNKVK